VIPVISFKIENFIGGSVPPGSRLASMTLFGTSETFFGASHIDGGTRAFDGKRGG